MPKVNTGRLPGKPTTESIQAQITRLTTVMNGQLEYGTTTAEQKPLIRFAGQPGGGTTFHNGTMINVQGSWVEALVTGISSVEQVTCVHNLYLDDPNYTLPVSERPNCRWQHWGSRHDGTAADVTTVFGTHIMYHEYTTGLVLANEITLQFFIDPLAGTAPTVDVLHPVIVSLFFTKAIKTL